jgi:hypothetical protein
LPRQSGIREDRLDRFIDEECMSKRDNQVSVPPMRNCAHFVERAEHEDRTIAAQIRHYVAEVARRATETGRVSSQPPEASAAPNIGAPGAPPSFQPGARVAADASPGLTDADFGDDAPGRTASMEFKVEFPTDLKLPDGIEIKYDDRDPVHGPILAEAHTLAREVGLDQTTFSKMLGLQAKLELRQHDVELARANIEKQSITNFDALSAAVISFLDRHLSAEQSRAIQAGVHSRAAFERDRAANREGDRPHAGEQQRAVE